jgi:outer membrane murein-binding lipoprotein Lpp
MIDQMLGLWSRFASVVYASLLLAGGRSEASVGINPKPQEAKVRQLSLL